MKPYNKILILLSIWVLPVQNAFGQTDQVRWISFEELEVSLSIVRHRLADGETRKRKPVFINFYTDWCVYCKKMDRVVFNKADVIKLLNDKYYAVKFNAESRLEIQFSGHVLGNDQVGKSRKPLHQITQLLALRDGEFVAPTMLILNEDFEVEARYFEFLDEDELLEVLKNYD
ncbi:hypothetical protein BST97_07710 [Nonlabens spongiae]|uniref:Thioredoxin-like fold domain-containing protein n=1 Tax=Nonlabens spongiae TaxID=331648 RepID=A0A1W6MJW1_9FLAO|nr:thioredoxin family protein [Nonlabens spongiae]ARN77895.1 hypothetical protein BST97_07710 [Nonlabens spongiae]